MPSNSDSDELFAANLVTLKSLFPIVEHVSLMSYEPLSEWCQQLDPVSLAQLAHAYQNLDRSSMGRLSTYLIQLTREQQAGLAINYEAVLNVFRVLGQLDVAPFADKTIINAYDHEPSEGWSFLPERYHVLIPLAESIAKLEIGTPLRELPAEWHASMWQLAGTLSDADMENLYSLSTRGVRSWEERTLYLVFVQLDAIRCRNSFSEGRESSDACDELD